MLNSDEIMENRGGSMKKIDKPNVLKVEQIASASGDS